MSGAMLVEELEGLRARDRYRHFKTGGIDAIAGFVMDPGEAADPADGQKWLVVHYPTGEPSRPYARPLEDFRGEVNSVDDASGEVRRVARYELVEGQEPDALAEERERLREFETLLLEREERVRHIELPTTLVEERDNADRLAQALIWTREYVGEDVLPEIEGWSWFDALRAHQNLRAQVPAFPVDRTDPANPIGGGDG